MGVVAGSGADCRRGRFGAGIGNCDAGLAVIVYTPEFVSVKQRLGQSGFGALMAKARSSQSKLAAS